jgi:hypothetical protein
MSKLAREEIDALIRLIRETSRKYAVSTYSECLNPMGVLRELQTAERALGEYVALHGNEIIQIVQVGRALYQIEDESLDELERLAREQDESARFETASAQDAAAAGDLEEADQHDHLAAEAHASALEYWGRYHAARARADG